VTGLPAIVGWAAVLCYAVATATLHLELSLWLVTPLDAGAWAGWRPAQALGLLPWLLGGGLLLYLALMAWHRADRSRTLLFWGLWLGCVALADRWILFSGTERIHYVQYAVLAWLTAWVMDPERQRWPFGAILLFCTLVGIADEIYQYTHETLDYSDYLDFNDFLLNLLGAAAGLLLYYGFRAAPCTPGGGYRAGTLGFPLLGGMMLLLLYLVTAPTAKGSQAAEDRFATTFPIIERRPDSYGHWREGPLNGRYLILDPWTGTLLLTGLGMVFARFPAGQSHGGCNTEANGPSA
jgi:hypothetical protein